MRYFNNKNEIVTKKHATEVLITEYDADGNIINSIYGTFDDGETNLIKVTKPIFLIIFVTILLILLFSVILAIFLINA